MVATVRDGRLTAAWRFPGRHREEIGEMAAGFAARVGELVDHGLAAEPAFTPSDFPGAGLSQDEQDAFLDELA